MRFLGISELLPDDSTVQALDLSYGRLVEIRRQFEIELKKTV
jgi:hypothetical protein